MDRKTRYLRALVLTLPMLAVVVIAGCLTLAQAAGSTGGGRLSGQVASLDGKAPFGLPGLAGATVEVEPGGFSSVTNKKGFFSLPVSPGVYQVTFSAPGYQEYSQQIVVSASAATSVTATLFPAPAGKPVASLTRGGRKSETGPVPYNTSVTVDATGSQSVSRQGISWEIMDDEGNVVADPYAVPATPLQLEPSPIPGSSPLSFTFTPPAPGTYTIKLVLENEFGTGPDSSAEVVIEALNTPPQAAPIVIAGPNPPQKQPSGELKQSTGLTAVEAGSRVYLAARALDQNVPSPELYNPGGRTPDAYGKNDDWLQRQFAWSWKLEYVAEDGTREELTEALVSDGQTSAAGTQYPWFTADRPGQYIASLVVEDQDISGSLASEPASVTVTVLPSGEALISDEASCLTCHEGYLVDSMSCQSCHGPAYPHLTAQGETKRATMATSYEAGQCGQCHQEYSEWEKSRHSDGYPYGYYEIAQPLLLNCAKCHYPQGFADAIEMAKAAGTDFGHVEFKKPMYPNGPLFFDFSKLPEPLGYGVACQACHDPHQISASNEAGLRLPKDKICGTCHEEKWQNVLLEGTAGVVGSAYEYPGQEYSTVSPHNTADKCVLCHMDTDIQTTDAQGVPVLGGHTLRMRDAGPDGTLGGADDILNTTVCRQCHTGLDTFNFNGRQDEIKGLWEELGGLLKKHNSGILPDYKPGDKCATCHKGGTLPFDNDPHLTLENAYTNYKLIKNDRSWGVHNYQYTKELLEDSLDAVRALDE